MFLLGFHDGDGARRERDPSEGKAQDREGVQEAGKSAPPVSFIPGTFAHSKRRGLRDAFSLRPSLLIL